eukprot:365219-Chlamydomonas_euryale.AAC.54
MAIREWLPCGWRSTPLQRLTPASLPLPAPPPSHTHAHTNAMHHTTRADTRPPRGWYDARPPIPALQPCTAPHQSRAHQEAEPVAGVWFQLDRRNDERPRAAAHGEVATHVQQHDLVGGLAGVAAR